MAVRIKAK